MYLDRFQDEDIEQIIRRFYQVLYDILVIKALILRCILFSISFALPLIGILIEHFILLPERKPEWVNYPFYGIMMILLLLSLYLSCKKMKNLPDIQYALLRVKEVKETELDIDERSLLLELLQLLKSPEDNQKAIEIFLQELPCESRLQKMRIIVDIYIAYGFCLNPPHLR